MPPPIELQTPTPEAGPTLKTSRGRYALSPPGESLIARRTKTHNLTQVTTSSAMDSFTLVRNCDQLRSACEALDRYEAIGLDCESTHLDPHKGRLRLTQLSNDTHTYIIDHDRFQGACGYQSLKQLLEAPKPRTVTHNGKFDQKWLLHKLGIEINGLFDSMLATMLIQYSPGSHNLETVAQTYLDITIDKTLRMSDWSAPELSQEQLTYAARDSQVLIPLRQALIKLLAKDNLFRVAQLEFANSRPGIRRFRISASFSIRRRSS